MANKRIYELATTTDLVDKFIIVDKLALVEAEKFAADSLATTTDLTNYVTIATTQSILGQKTFQNAVSINAPLPQFTMYAGGITSLKLTSDALGVGTFTLMSAGATPVGWITRDGANLIFEDTLTGPHTLTQLAGAPSPWTVDANGITYGTLATEHVGIGTASVATVSLTVKNTVSDTKVFELIALTPYLAWIDDDTSLPQTVEHIRNDASVYGVGSYTAISLAASGNNLGTANGQGTIALVNVTDNSISPQFAFKLRSGSATFNTHFKIRHNGDLHAPHLNLKTAETNILYFDPADGKITYGLSTGSPWVVDATGINYPTNIGVGEVSTSSWAIQAKGQDGSGGLVTHNNYPYVAWVDYPSGAPNRANFFTRETSKFGVNDFTAIALSAKSASGNVSYTHLVTQALDVSNHSSRFNMLLRGNSGSSDYRTILSFDYDSRYLWKTESGNVTHFLTVNNATQFVFGYDAANTSFAINPGNAFGTENAFKIAATGATTLTPLPAIQDTLSVWGNMPFEAWNDNATVIPKRCLFVRRALQSTPTTTAGDYVTIALHAKGASGMNAYVFLACEADSSTSQGAIFNVALRGGGTAEYFTHLKINHDGEFYMPRIVTSAEAVTLRYTAGGTPAGLVSYPSSDISFKKDVLKWDEDALDVLTKFSPKSFTWKADEKQAVGWIAQEGYEFLPGMFPKHHRTKKHMLAEVEIMPYFHKAIQQLLARIEELENQ